MKAWRFHGFNDLRMEELPVPECGPGQVMVKVLCVQPSVTEARLARGIRTLAYEKIKRRLETEAPLSLFGHEFCVRIIETGPGVTRFEPGDRVAARALLPCGNCSFCHSERSQLCREGPIIGFDCPGCFSEYAVLPEEALVKVDDKISDSEAACLQSLSDSVASVEIAQIQMGESVAIFGQGSMGLDCMQVARSCGTANLITVDVREEACSLSKELGADHALNANECDPIAAIQDLTNGEGVDVVFEAAGGSAQQGLAEFKTLMQSFRAARSGGRVVQISWFGQPLQMDVDLLRERSLQYLFPLSSSLAHLEHTVRLVASGRVQLKPVITHVLQGIESVPQAFEITSNKAKFKAINPAQVLI